MLCIKCGAELQDPEYCSACGTDIKIYKKLIRLSTRRVNVRGQKVERLDNGEYGRRVVVAATVTPDFRSEELCKAYGVMDPLEVPGRMLLAGEYERLSREILSLSGFDDDLEEQAKN